MTDFFADLEAEIRAAHPRRPKPVVPVRMVASAAVALAALAVAVGLLTRTSVEQERVATPPVAVACSDATPPALREAFAVLRKERAAADDMPQEVTERVDRTVEGLGRDATVHGAGARRVAQGWIVPVVVGPPCDDTATKEQRIPAVIVVSDDGAVFGRLADIEAGGLRLATEETAYLVTDGTEAYLRTPDGEAIEGKIEDNVLASADAAELVMSGTEYTVIPGGACGTTFTDDPAPDVVADVLGVFRSGVPKAQADEFGDRGGLTGEYLRGAHVYDARRVIDQRPPGLYWKLLAVSDLPEDHDRGNCATEREPHPDTPPRPGACAIHERGDGAASEQIAGCWTLEEIEAGEAFTEFRDGKLRTIFGLVPDSAEMVEVWDGAETRPEHNLLLFFTQEERNVRLRFLE
jgi:hypothetical protein